MNENIIKRNDLLSKKVMKGLESRNMSAYYAKDKEEALKIALSLIPEGSTATMGGAMSAHEIGLPQALADGNYTFIDRDKMEDKRAAMLAAYDADWFLRHDRGRHHRQHRRQRQPRLRHCPGTQTCPLHRRHEQDL